MSTLTNVALGNQLPGNRRLCGTSVRRVSLRRIRQRPQTRSRERFRRVTGYQDFVDEAPLDLVYVANYGRMTMVPARQRESYTSVAAGAISQNVYLFAASAGLSTVIRAWIDREAIANALGLTHDQQALLSQTIGYPRS